MRALVVLCVWMAVGCVTSASPANAQPSGRARGAQSVQARVRELLSGVEDAPTRQELLSLGDDAFEVLVEIQRDPSELGVTRLRAITCASWFPAARSRAFLRALLDQETLDPLQRRAALRGYGAQLGREGPLDASALEPIVRHARDADVAVREAVLLALLELRGQAAASPRALLEQTIERLLAAEPDADLVRATRARMAR